MTNDIADRIAEKIREWVEATSSSIDEAEAMRQLAAIVRTELETMSVLNQSAFARIVEVATAGGKQTADPDARERFKWIVERATNPIISPVAQDGWQDIESAPRDGSRILVRPMVVVARNWGDDGSGRWLDDYGEEVFQDPTHWQPLPQEQR